MPIAAPPEAASRGVGAPVEALSAKQLEMLETGLRFVRSSLTMDVKEPTDSVVASRTAALDQLAELERHFGMKPR
ncbi:hypothetical protein [Alienimonas chondri]|uniref:Uncharacterized protein n=1 Tax=Alienimonas chondri TaxID=2681879 RepID=A0ABX1VHU2_9PLAN|nr:hypothetical protein [Alienimonas chondri]NNJ27036.1 hypothetical protein [Alienimonas chondri]